MGDAKKQREGESLRDYDERRANEDERDAQLLPAVEAALTQCQHIAYDESVALGRALDVPAGSLAKTALRDLAHKALAALQRINSIAESSEADNSFVAELERIANEEEI
jgi:hypothetical protein